MEKLRSEIANQFELGSASVTQDARILFRPGQDYILAGNEAMQSAWLVRIQRARARYSERVDAEQSSLRAERRIMAGWLRRAGPR